MSITFTHDNTWYYVGFRYLSGRLRTVCFKMRCHCGDKIFELPHGHHRIFRILLGILQIMVNLSPDPTGPGGSELPTFSYGGEGIPRVLKQYRFSPHRYIFPIRWSNQLNQSERRIYAPLTWITTDSGNGLESARRQAIAWTIFYFVIN